MTTPWYSRILLPAALLLGAGAAPALQNPAGKPQGPAPDPRGPSPATQGRRPQGPQPAPEPFRTFDRALALIGDKVITESRIRDALEVALEAELRDIQSRRPGARLSPRVVESIRRDLVRREVENIIEADKTGSLGFPKDAIENYVRRTVDRILEEKRRESGSWPAFVKNLERSGLSVQDFREQQSQRVRLELVQQEETRRLIRGGALHLTPQELYRYFRAHRGEFRRPGEAVLEILRFEAKGGKTAAARAKAALALLSKDPKAELPPGLRPEGRQSRTITENDGTAAVLRNFAFDPSTRPGSLRPGPGGLEGPTVRLIRLLRRTLPKEPDFLDPEVQRRITRVLRDRRKDRIRLKILYDSLRRVQTWPPDLFRR